MSKELNTNLTEQLANDPEFRKEFVDNPQPILAKLGIVYPADVTVHVTETTDKDVYFPIPAVATGELVEHELENVAGGRLPMSF